MFSKIAAALFVLTSVFSAYHYVSQNHYRIIDYNDNITSSYRFTPEEMLSISRGIPTSNLNVLWDKYVKKHRLFFGAAESSHRFRIFKANYDTIISQNAKNASYKLGLTPFTHITREEFAATMLGYRPRNSVRNPVRLSISDIPDTKDWVDDGAITSVKIQGDCGGCWAISAAGALEGLNFINNNILMNLSSQELIDCSTSYGNQGCNGGVMDYAFEYTGANGISSDASYPYITGEGKCMNGTVTKVFKNKNFVDVVPNDSDQLVAAIAKQPVSVGVAAASDTFQFYISGIITGDACGTDVDHGVLACGYGTDTSKYIKLKNSWGEDWGEAGYVFVAQGPGAGVCGVNKEVSYPI